MSGRSAGHVLAVFGPLLLLGFAAGAVRALSFRPGLPEPRRRLLVAGWVLMLLVGAPVWLFLSAALGL